VLGSAGLRFFKRQVCVAAPVTDAAPAANVIKTSDYRDGRNVAVIMKSISR